MDCASLVGPPYPQHAFSTRADHEAAMVEAGRVGPTPGIFADELLPPLRHTTKMLVNAARLLPQYEWEEMPIEQIDPRAPWRHVTLGSFWGLEESGCVMIRGAGPLIGWEALLLAQHAGATTEHLLVRSGSRSPVRFGGRSEAVQALGPTVYADGVLPAGWAWNPLPDLRWAIWTPTPVNRRSPGLAEVFWRGRSGRWAVQVWSAERATASRNRKRIVEADGFVREFSSVAAAKSFCIGADAAFATCSPV